MRTKNFLGLLQISLLIDAQPTDKVSPSSMHGVAVDGDLFPDHPFRLLANKSSPQAQLFKSIDYMTGTTSQEGHLLHVLLSTAVQRNFGFNISVGIPADFICNGMVKPYIEEHYNGSQDVQKAVCAFYTSSSNADVVSNRAVDFMGDMIAYIDTSLMLDFHASLGGCRTYHYSFDIEGPVKFYPFPPTRWLHRGGGDMVQSWCSSSRTTTPSGEGRLMQILPQRRDMCPIQSLSIGLHLLNQGKSQYFSCYRSCDWPFYSLVQIFPEALNSD